jgi:hypothetical protein
MNLPLSACHASAYYGPLVLRVENTAVHGHPWQYHVRVRSGWSIRTRGQPTLSNAVISQTFGADFYYSLARCHDSIQALVVAFYWYEYGRVLAPLLLVRGPPWACSRTNFPTPHAIWDPLSTAGEHYETFLSLAMLEFPISFWNRCDPDSDPLYMSAVAVSAE